MDWPIERLTDRISFGKKKLIKAVLSSREFHLIWAGAFRNLISFQFISGIKSIFTRNWRKSLFLEMFKPFSFYILWSFRA